MKTATEILLENGYHANPNTYFCFFTGKHNGEIKRFSKSINKPTNSLGMYEGINPTNYGFEIILDHGALCEPSVIKFPKFATEVDFTGAFSRLEIFINANYSHLAGLPPFIWGD